MKKYASVYIKLLFKLSFSFIIFPSKCQNIYIVVLTVISNQVLWWLPSHFTTDSVPAHFGIGLTGVGASQRTAGAESRDGLVLRSFVWCTICIQLRADEGCVAVC